ncbi:hypothetical protein [Candidatus Sodalis pierantonius]|uniref:hypothetical protein n=1 Tax=Candidatus Sodalis pierantonii TaxID=1486991 RepID=UPI00130E8AAE|nr:hypothetical protein [Candidatus Sodalis pierantonius]
MGLWFRENPGTGHPIYGSLVLSPAGGPGVIVAASFILRKTPGVAELYDYY